MATGSDELDEIDEEIIRMLQANARISIAEMARELNTLTENAIRYRIDKLESRGYIKNYTVQLDYQKFGKTLIVIFNFNIAPKHIDGAIRYLDSLENMTDIYLTSGSNNLVAVGYFTDQDEVTKFVTEDLRRINLVTFDSLTVLQRIRHRLYGI